MKKCVEFVKKEMVLSIALVLAVISSFVIMPDAEYLTYIDFRTLAILFCLMAVMAGLKKIGVFGLVAGKLIARVRTVSQLVLILVLLCFFFSMLITNDVALITFVPFTFIVLRMMDRESEEKLIVPVVVLQTIAANLGSMLTPIGNPQNLYLYGRSGMGPGEFILLMLPCTAISLILLIVWCIICTRRFKGKMVQGRTDGNTSEVNAKGRIVVYLFLFLLCLLTVARIIPYGVTLTAVIIVVAVMDRKVLGQVDYALLLTFIGFFVFIGNMGRVPAFREFLENIVMGNEVLTAVVSSQVISNVPAALLLSGFTSDYAALIVGTNLGGLGTLIASMASLISFKYIGAEVRDKKGAYLLYFTLANLVFLAVLLAWQM